MKSVIKGLLCAAVTLLIGNTALAEVVTNIRLPFEIVQPTVFNACNGDTIVLTGDIHILITTTVDANGGLHVNTHFQPGGASGVGVPSGLTYRAVGETRQATNVTSGAAEFTLVNNFRMIAPGSGGGSLHVHGTTHITINANGTATADVTLQNVDCR